MTEYTFPEGSRLTRTYLLDKSPASILVLLIVAFATRAALFGDPLIHVDETFYNLVGERMLTGAVPYVDIWDRKPVGLFLIYAGAHLIFGSGVIGYQLLATFSAVLTALGIKRLARSIASERGSLLAAIAYICGLAIFRCSGGQSPVFYNLPMVLAAGIVLQILTSRQYREIIGHGCLAMLLVGIALQIKYSVVFEGIGMGLALLWALWRQQAGPVRISLAFLAWVACALLPTALALEWYWRAGDADAFVWANFISIFVRNTGAALSVDRITDLLTDIGLTLPFWGGIVYFRFKRHDAHFTPEICAAEPREHALRWLQYWALLAVAGFLVFGTYYDHYTAALLPSLSVLIAPVLGREPAKRWSTCLIIGFVLTAGTAILIANMVNFGGRNDLSHASGLIRRELHGRCLYVFEGNAALYSASNACLVTRYAFPQHISGATDSGALGEDSEAVLKRILARRPGVIVTGVKPVSPRPNWRVRPLLERVLSRDYEAYALVHLGRLKLRLYRLKTPRS